MFIATLLCNPATPVLEAQLVESLRNAWGGGVARWLNPGIAAEFASPWVILGLWAAGGLLCLAGGFTLAELAAMDPTSGGVYVFIREGFGECGGGVL